MMLIIQFNSCLFTCNLNRPEANNNNNNNNIVPLIHIKAIIQGAEKLVQLLSTESVRNKNYTKRRTGTRPKFNPRQ
jgi:hypothetical protein